MAKIKEVISFLESTAHPSLQEPYDNSGLIVGDLEAEINGVLISLDCTEDVVQEAISKSCNLIISHHPIVFSGLKQLTGKSYVERTVINAIKNNVAIYAIHTNLDNVSHGVNGKIAALLGLTNTKLLSPKSGQMSKIVTFIPKENTDNLIEQLSAVGAGTIGNYSRCSFTVSGTGTFQGNEQSKPAVGTKGKFVQATENRLEMIYPNHLTNKLINSLIQHHPYEEPAYYITRIENTDSRFGAGMVGTLNTPVSEDKFLEQLKQQLNLKVIRHTQKTGSEVSRVAVCGGSGSFLLKHAISTGADVFVTGDFKYHEFFDAEGRIMICDVGHYESEAFTKELIYELLTQEFNTFAVNLSDTNTNPVNYYY